MTYRKPGRSFCPCDWFQSGYLGRHHRTEYRQTVQAWSNKFLTFFYGFRTVIPVMIGATGCSFQRFILLSSAGAALWSIAVTAAGMFCGKALLLFMTDIKTYRLWCISGLGIIGTIFWAIHHFKHRPPG